MRTERALWPAVAALCLAVGSCASTSQAPPAAIAPGTVSASPTSYVLNEEELELDCKKLTGRMQVRILQIRDYESSSQTTLVSRALRSVGTTLFGGTSDTSSSADRYARDRAMLEAYNRQLASKSCPTFNLEAELKPKPAAETPTPVASPANSVAPAAAVSPAQ